MAAIMLDTARMSGVLQSDVGSRRLPQGHWAHKEYPRSLNVGKALIIYAICSDCLDFGYNTLYFWSSKDVAKCLTIGLYFIVLRSTINTMFSIFTNIYNSNYIIT